MPTPTARPRWLVAGDRTALPYGFNTVSLFADVFLEMLSVKLGALSAGLDDAMAVVFAWARLVQRKAP